MSYQTKNTKTMSVQNPLQILDSSEYPKFNGNKITSIYAVYENSRYSDTIHGRGYIADILFYNCYYRGYNRETSKHFDGIMKVKNLPEPFNLFMGKIIQNKNRSFFVKDFCIRTSKSGHASPDDTLSLWGWAGNATTETAHMYRGNKMDKPENNYVLDSDKGIGLHILENILSKEFEVEEIEFANCGYKMEEGSLDFASKYPYAHTPIRFIDGCVYPDEKLPSWRWLHGMPYRRPNGVEENDKRFIRVWDEDSNSHYYLTKVENLEVGDTNLVQVTFQYKRHEIYGNEGFAYCNIRRFNKEYNHEFVRFDVTRKGNDGAFYGKISNPKVKFNEREQQIYPSDLYQVSRVWESLTYKSLVD